MADRRRIVTLDAAGTPTTVLDLETGANYQSVGDTFVIKAAPKNQIKARHQRRYGGSRVVGEIHDNATIGWKMLVKGASVDNAILNFETAVKVFEAARTDLYYEWRPEGATSSVFYEVRGPVAYNAEYSWRQMTGALSWYCTAEMDVGPLALAAPTTYNIASTNLPAVVALAAVPGDAPALANVTLRTSGGASAPIWCLLGWTKHPAASGLSGTPPAPFGIIEAETGVSLSGWAAIGSDATYRGSNGLRIATSGAGTALAEYIFDPSLLVADDFSQGDIDIEVWGRIQVDSGVVSPVLTASVYAGNLTGRQTYTAEFGSAGKPIVLPSATAKFRMVRLGVLTMPVDPATPVPWRMRIAGSWQAASTGNVGLDYFLLVPATARACSKSGVPNDAAYADFIISTVDISKRIMGADLSGATGLGAGNKGRDSGLGGSPIELPAGVDVDMLIKLSSLVPDDPTIDATTEQLAHTGTTGSVVVWPRYFVAKGA